MRVAIMTSSWRTVILLGLVALAFSEVNGKKSEKERSETGRQPRGGIWIGGGGGGGGGDHGHGHGWMKLHNDRHHDHSTKLSEAYVKFHGLGEKDKKGGAGILGRIGNVLSKLGIGRGDPEEEANEGGWGSSNNDNNNNNNNNNNGGGSWSNSGGNSGGNNNGGGGWGNSGGSSGGSSNGGGGGWGNSGGGGGAGGKEFITVTVHGRPKPMMSSGGGGSGGSGGWGPPPMMQMQSGWGNPQMQMVVAQPTGWASANNQMNSNNNNQQGGNSGGSKGGNGGGRPQTGWASGDFASYKPPKGKKNQKFQLNLPTGKPAYIQKLKPIIDLPKVQLHGWRR